MYTVEPVGGCVGGECYLVMSGASAVLLDSGFDFCAEKTVGNIRAALGGRRLDLILLTHSHYDHATGSATIRRAFPECRVAAGRLTDEIFHKPGAIRLMRTLNAGVACEKGWPEPADRLDELRVDIPLDDNGVVRLRDMTIRAVATPGHTRCSVSYLFEEEGLLACSETAGIAMRYPEVAPCLIVGYRVTMDSIARLRELGAKRVFVSHFGVIPEDGNDRFFADAAAVVEEAVALIVGCHRRGDGIAETAAAFTVRFYDSFRDVQPERAFILNTEALIPRILEELGLERRTA